MPPREKSREKKGKQKFAAVSDNAQYKPHVIDVSFQGICDAEDRSRRVVFVAGGSWIGRAHV